MTDRRMTEVITFDTEWGKYRITRRERIRLAILHGLPDAKARELGFRPRTIPGPATETFSADFLADHYSPNGVTTKVPPFPHEQLPHRSVRAPISSRSNVNG